LASRAPALRTCLSTILAVWAAHLAILGALQVVGAGFGYHVWPLGEDRGWIGFLQESQGSRMTRLFWSVNDRNPLSPWWYLAVSPLIMGSDSGLYLVRKLIDPLLAISAFLLFDRLTSGRARSFALTAALVVLLWNFSRYVEQITWNFLGALALSLICVWAYLAYVQSGRRRVEYFLLSLLSWFGAFATYTLQSGAILAIALLAFIQAPIPGNESTWSASRRRMWAAVRDVWPYAVLFVLFLMIWTTTASEASRPAYRLELGLVGRQLFSSLENALWHGDFAQFGAWMTSAFPGIEWAAIIAVSGIAMTAVLRMLDLRFSSGTSESEIEWRGPLLCLAVTACLIAPTIAVEALSSVWFPGTRTPMVQQVWSPTLYLSTVVCLGAGIARFAPAVGRGFMQLCIAVLLGATLAMGLAYNAQLVETTRRHQALASGLGVLAAGVREEAGFIVRPEGIAWPDSDTLSDAFIQTWLRRRNMHMRILRSAPAPDPAWATSWRVQFERDVVGNAILFGRSLPYSQVQLVSFDGRNVRPLDPATEEDFRGFQVDWLRSAPIRRSDVAQVPECPLVWRSSRDPDGDGWSVAETDPAGRGFRWIAAVEATLRLHGYCRSDARVSIVVAQAMSPDILASLRVSIAGTVQQLESEAGSAETLLHGIVPARLLSGPNEIPITFRVNRTVVPAGGTRTLAVAVRELRVEPVRP
jgi:hypothetical protein